MKRVSLALVLAFAVWFALLAGSAWAWARGTFVAVHSGNVNVFVSSGRPFFFNHGFFVRDRVFVHHGFFFHPRFVSPFFVTSPVVVASPVVVDDPPPQPSWVPGQWWWNGFQRVWTQR